MSSKRALVGHGTRHGTGYRAGAPPIKRTTTVAPATWQYPTDRAHAGTVAVPAQTRKGDTVRVRVDDRGHAAAAPPRPDRGADDG
ncbi:hypothetical protein [Streptomyces sp. NPDC101132]|uniref:hypothetical protein n=1 Tax=Streptomyces sp. NPDC101132 TaxID=3366110 RepID=UPI0038108D60